MSNMPAAQAGASVSLTAAKCTAGEDAEAAAPERISMLSRQLSRKLDASISEIQSINIQTKLLSMNARIEAARAGEAGATFGVVASEMIGLAKSTAAVCQQLRTDMLDPIHQLQTISTALATNVRGTRLADLAHVNIDLIDRNLYERSCDVRWWAADDSIVRAAQTHQVEACQHACKRMAVILGAYTVYADLVLCDLDGRILANGRKLQHKITRSLAGQKWFRDALETRTGEEFAFETAHRMPEVGDSHVLVFSCCVRENGNQQAKPIGVLGVIFKWENLAQTIVQNTPVPAVEKPFTRVMIVDGNGAILADSQNQLLQEMPDFAERGELFKTNKSFLSLRLGKGDAIVAHALSPGFETYASGWHSVIIQERPV